MAVTPRPIQPRSSASGVSQPANCATVEAVAPGYLRVEWAMVEYDVLVEVCRGARSH